MTLWKVTTAALLFLMAAALVTGLVVANWSGSAMEHRIRAIVVAGPQPPAPVVARRPPVPPPAVVTACNQFAAGQVRSVPATGGTVEPVGAGAGPDAGLDATAANAAPYGLDERRKHDARYRRAYAGCLRARGYAG